MKICPVCGNASLSQERDHINCILCGYTFIFESCITEYQEESQEEKRIFEINEKAQYYFTQQIKEKEAVKYFKQRKLSKSDVKSFELGFDNGHLNNYLLSSGFSMQEIEMAGLAKYENDFFYKRITIPIKDNIGRIIGFGGRNIEDGASKYINTPETTVFHKKGVFFGIHAINPTKPIILCEGYFDVLTLQKYGFNAMATMGTALTLEHALLLARFHQPLYLLYDNDVAGRKATMKNLKLLQSIGIPCTWIDLNPVKDPDEFLNQYSVEDLKQRFLQPKQRKELVLNNLQIADIKEVIDYLAN